MCSVEPYRGAAPLTTGVLTLRTAPTATGSRTTLPSLHVSVSLEAYSAPFLVTRPTVRLLA